MGDLRYCFEQEYVEKTLKNTMERGLAVIDSDGIPESVIREAVDRGVFIYDYLNAGALEKERSYYSDYMDLRLAKYEGWPGEYWIDPTSPRWKQHLVDEAQKKKEIGAIGLYFDNADIYWMCLEGFREQRCRMLRQKPSAQETYEALRDVIAAITNELGLIVMPNGADLFVRKLFEEGRGQSLIRTINQEGCMYEDFRLQSASEKKYRTEYMDWAKKQGLHVRGIEYVNSVSGALKARAYYQMHGWNDVYISRHKDLRGD